MQFEYELLDLLHLVSVQSAAGRLLKKYPRLDSLILNAGVGGWTTVDWLKATRRILSGLVHAVTYPDFKKSTAGDLAKPQLPHTTTSEKEPPLGEVFCANVFGHYLLAHYLMAPLSRSRSGRIVWVSSIEAYGSMFSLDDFQSLRTTNAYEGTKRLTDVLVLTSSLPSTVPYVDTYFSSSEGNKTSSARGPDKSSHRPRMLVAHPGVCATGIMPLIWIASIAMVAIFYIARWCGSIWHTVDPYTGACSPVWLALAAEETLASLEAQGGVSKWGSATDLGGSERVERTEVDGWGFGGIPGDGSIGGKKKGRNAGAKDLTKEGREAFEELGRAAWKQMEELRVEWEDRLDRAAVSKDPLAAAAKRSRM